MCLVISGRWFSSETSRILIDADKKYIWRIRWWGSRFMRKVEALMYVCMYVCVPTYIHRNICMHYHFLFLPYDWTIACILLYLICVYVCMYVEAVLIRVYLYLIAVIGSDRWVGRCGGVYVCMYVDREIRTLIG